jgi:uncharacterized membrane protein (DUF4010 family)
VVAWLRSSKADAANGESARNPVELLPALMFVAIVAAGAVGTRWAQQSFGQQGAALSLFITGTFDVDAAIVTLSGLPAGTLVRDVAAVAIAGTVVANMLVKMAVTGLFARWRGSTALIGLGASTAVLIGTMVWRLVMGVATA